MVDTLGLPTVFFTHSAADLHWPELAHLICPDDPESRCSRNTALLEIPAIADCFFHHRIHKFVEAFYVGILGAPTTGYALSGSIVAVLMSVASLGSQMLLKWKRYWSHMKMAQKTLSNIC